MSTTTTTYVEFSLNYIDSPFFQQKIAQILAGDVDPRHVNWDELIGDQPNSPNLPEHVTERVEGEGSSQILSGISLGLLIPLLIVCLFLLVLGICVLRHSLNKRCARIDRTSFISMFRATPYGDRSRISTRSTNPLQRAQDERLSGRSTVSTISNAKAPVFVTKVTRLGSIRESPEDYYKKYMDYKGSVGGTITPDSQSSMSSVFSRMTTDYGNILSNSAMYPINDKTDTPVPIPILSPADKPISAQSFPNLILSTQDSVIPYRLTWITPSSAQSWITPSSAQSEPLVNHLPASTLERRLFAQLEKKTDNVDINMLSATSATNTSKISDKSPFHPNNNTPTTGSDGENLPEDVFINRTHSLGGVPDSLQLSHNNSAGTPLLNALGSSLVRRQIHSVGSTASTLERSCQSARSTSLSLPHGATIGGSWHYNDIYRTDNKPYLMKNLLMPGNVSLSHSKQSSGNQGKAENVDGLREQVGNGNERSGREAGNANGMRRREEGIGHADGVGRGREDVSMCANIGSSNTSMSRQPSEHQLPHPSEHQFPHPAEHQFPHPAEHQFLSRAPPSANTSLCAHMDSNETTHTCNSSVITGINSDLAFGADQGQGHSTSIEHVGDVTTAEGSYFGTTGASHSDSIQALSAIQSSSVVTEGTQTDLQCSGEGSEVTADEVPSFASTTRSAPAVLSRPRMPRPHCDSPAALGRGFEASGLSLHPPALANIPEDEGSAGENRAEGAGVMARAADDSYLSPIAALNASSGDERQSVQTPASGRSLDWDGFPFYFFIDETGENRRGSAGTVRNVDLNHRRVSDNDRTSTKFQQEVVQDANTGQYLAVSEEPALSDQSEDGSRRRSGHAIVGDCTRRRSGQPLLDDKQYWV